MNMVVEDVIRIGASPEIVWAITADVERWPEWTPTVTSAKRVGQEPFGVGSITRIRQPAQPESEWIVTEFDAGRRFAWETRRRGLRMLGVHEIGADGDGTRNTLQLHASGVLALLLWPILRPAIRRALADENAGLKRRCEQVAAAGPEVGRPASG